MERMDRYEYTLGRVRRGRGRDNRSWRTKKVQDTSSVSGFYFGYNYFPLHSAIRIWMAMAGEFEVWGVPLEALLSF
jgi:hypothetical protein